MEINQYTLTTSVAVDFWFCIDHVNKIAGMFLDKNYDGTVDYDFQNGFKEVHLHLYDLYKEKMREWVMIEHPEKFH